MKKIEFQGLSEKEYTGIYPKITYIPPKYWRGNPRDMNTKFSTKFDNWWVGLYRSGIEPSFSYKVVKEI